MGKRLRDNLSSGYFEAADRLTSKDARRRVVAYVESYDDVFFWRSILSDVETDKLFFEVMLPSREKKLERGKKAALMAVLADKVGKNMIACVDADYDYLEQGATETSRIVIGNPYVFHTYAYAIENLQCYAPSLHEVCVAVTLNDHSIFNFDEYLRQYSQAIFPLFVWSIWFYRTPNYREYTINDFLKDIEMGNFSVKNAANQINLLRHKVNKKLSLLQHRHPEALQNRQQLIDNLASLGVTPDNTYLFIQGHHLFDKVVVPMMGKVCEKLVNERQNEIARESVHGMQRRNELSCYASRIEDIESMLRKNTGFLNSDIIQQIKTDLRNFVNQTCGR